jgi:iron complex transport system ATP-binding protein
VAIGGKSLCRDLEMSVDRGQVWGILGVNGAGKTTLLHTLAGLRAPASGEVFIDGQCPDAYHGRHLAQTLGILFQDMHDPFPSTVMETVLVGRHPYARPWQWESKQDWMIAEQALGQMALLDLANRRISTLSGGERQRLAIATLLAQQPQLYLLDEPTNHLDLPFQHRVLNTLRDLAQTGAAIIMVMHDVNLAARFCDHFLLMHGDGHHRSGEAKELLNEKELSALYGYPVCRLEGPNGPVFVGE